MPLTSDQVEAVLERFNEDPFVMLLMLEHADLNGGDPIRLARSPIQDIVSNGETFAKSWFNVSLPSDTGEPANCEISINNVSGEIGRALDGLTGAVEVWLAAVMASAPDDYAREFIKLKLRNVTWDAFYVSGELTQATIVNNRWPKYQVTPRFFRHLFA